MKRVLITGARGFVGQHCVPELLRAGYEVHAVSSVSVPSSENIAWHRCDLLDAEQTDALLKQVRPSHLLHTAWYVTPGKFWSAPENLLWVRASLQLLLSFQITGGQRIVILGTGAEYAVSPTPCSESSTPLAPDSLYGVSKNALHSMVAAYCRQSGLSHAWGRVFIPYGPGEAKARLVPYVINSLLDNQPAKCSAGTQLRDFVYVEDAANALVTLLGSKLEGAVNIGSGRAVLLSDVVTAIGRVLDRSDLIQLGAIPSNPSEAPVYTAGTERLYDELGWHPQYDLRRALQKTIDWWKLSRKHQA